MSCEILVISILSNIGVILVYKPPSFLEASLSDFLEILNRHVEKFEKCILLGDFNFPKIDWLNYTASGDSSNKFLQFCIEGGFEQLVNSPTRGQNILDLVLSCNCVIDSIELINMFLQTLDWNHIFYHCSGTIDLWAVMTIEPKFRTFDSNFESNASFGHRFDDDSILKLSLIHI